jgi:hypothetical protein
MPGNIYRQGVTDRQMHIEIAIPICAHTELIVTNPNVYLRVS